MKEIQMVGDVSNNNASEVEANEGENRINASEHVVDVNDELVKIVKGRVERARQSIEWRRGGPTISRVHENIRSDDMSAYEPTMVSIGPYHRSKECLKAMEELKWQVLDYHISNNEGTSITEYVQMMKGLEEETRRCYEKEILLGSEEFMMMMLLDGCFLLHTILGSLVYEPRFTMWFNNKIIHDLLKLENQLPYFIVQHLYDKLEPNRRCQFRDGHNEYLGEGEVNLKRAALYYFWSNTSLPISWWQDATPSLVQALQADHFLGLFHSGISKTLDEINPATKNLQLLPYKLSLPIDKSPSTIQDHNSMTFYGATDLAKSGVILKKRQAKTFLDISFHNVVLGIPAICIDDSTNPIFRNLIAFEQCCQIPVITIYSVFMDFILNTSKDVALLQQKGIMANGLGDGKEVATLFNRMCKNISYEHKRWYLGNIIQGLNSYRVSGRGILLGFNASVKAFFSTPFFMAVLAIYGLVFTVIQTLYTIRSYNLQVGSSASHANGAQSPMSKAYGFY